jgi:hypothetical protein
MRQRYVTPVLGRRTQGFDRLRLHDQRNEAGGIQRAGKREPGGTAADDDDFDIAVQDRYGHPVEHSPVAGAAP